MLYNSLAFNKYEDFMRVTSVNIFTRQNLGLQRQNTSFKSVENRSAGVEAARILMEPDNNNKADSDLVREDKKALVNFLYTTPYVMVKHNDEMTYIVADRDSYAGHQNEEEFDELFDKETRINRRMLKNFDAGRMNPAIQADLPALRRRLPENEPDYLMTMYDKETRRELGRRNTPAADVSNLARNLKRVATDYNPVYRMPEPEYVPGDLELISELYGIR